jgi:hypothetical protein
MKATHADPRGCHHPGKPVCRRPQRGEAYWYLSQSLFDLSRAPWDEDGTDEEGWRVGNVFGGLEQAEHARAKRVIYLLDDTLLSLRRWCRSKKRRKGGPPARIIVHTRHSIHSNFPPVRPRLSKYIHPKFSCVISRVQRLHTGGSLWYCICPLPDASLYRISPAAFSGMCIFSLSGLWNLTRLYAVSLLLTTGIGTAGVPAYGGRHSTIVQLWAFPCLCESHSSSVSLENRTVFATT